MISMDQRWTTFNCVPVYSSRYHTITPTYNPYRLNNSPQPQTLTCTHKSHTPPPAITIQISSFLTFTLEETLDAEVGNCKAQHRQLVQLGDDIRGERQQAGQPVQLSIQPVSVPLGRVGFLIGRRRLSDDEKDRGERDIDEVEWATDMCVCVCVCVD